MEHRRWQLRVGEGVSAFARDTLYRSVQACVPYTLVCLPMDAPDTDDNLILLAQGSDPSPLLSGFARETRPEGYAITVTEGAPVPSTLPVANGVHVEPQEEAEGPRQSMALLGADEAGCLYAVDDFIHQYLGVVCRFRGYIYNGLQPLFTAPMPPWRKSSAPDIPNRGLWTWGHVVRDYRGYLDNMAKWKMNTAIFWNDFRPVNAKEVVEYAHSRNISLIWGFTWCWGEPVDPNDPDQLSKWKARVLTTFEQDYAHCGDGVYFQTFTETHEKEIGGKPIAELAVAWVNEIAGALLEKHPGLWLQFGLHASSIRENAAALSKVDPRVTIVWEDAGGFPYHYEPHRQSDFPETLAYQKRLCSLRGEQERWGAVLKGFALIDWTRFEHQQGPFLLGESEPAFLQAWAAEKRPFFHWARGWWRQGAPLLRQFLQETRGYPLRECTVTALVEDSGWEVYPWEAVCLFAELLWDCESPVEDILRTVTQCGYTE